MKKKTIYRLLLLAGLSLPMASCGEKDIDFTEYSDYAAAFSLQEYGTVDVQYDNVGADVTFTTRVKKGGTDPNQTGHASLRVLTAEELVEYNNAHGSSYELMPEEYYTISAMDFTFTGEDMGKQVDVVLKGNFGLDPEAGVKDFVIPLQLSSETTKVNSDKNMLLVHPLIVTPVVSAEVENAEKLQMPNFKYAEQEYTALVSLLIDNEWEFKAVFERDPAKLQALVDKYNAETTSGITYQLLPASCYNLPENVAFTPGVSKVEVTFTLDNEIAAGQYVEEGNYLLPLALASIDGMPFDVSQNISYIPVEVGQRLDMVKLTLSKGMVSTNDEAGIWYSCGSAVDSDIATFWKCSEGASVKRDATYGAYVDINLAGNYTLEDRIKFAINVPFDATRRAEGIPSKMSLYAGTSANDLVEVAKNINCFASWSAGQTESKFTSEEYDLYELIDNPKFTYLRFAFLESTNNAQSKKFDLTQTGNTDTSGNVWSKGCVKINEITIWGR